MTDPMPKSDAALVALVARLQALIHAGLESERHLLTEKNDLRAKLQQCETALRDMWGMAVAQHTAYAQMCQRAEDALHPPTSPKDDLNPGDEND